MCYDPSARPPSPPISGGAVDITAAGVVLTGADGHAFAAHTATHPDRGGPGVVILPDVRGLHPFYQELAVRFAEAGVHATAFDYFGRTAGVGSGDARGEGFDFMSHVQRTRPATIAADVAATIAHVRSAAGGEATSVFTVGFCFGGRASFNQAGADHGLSGVIGFYGRVAEREPGDPEAPIRLAPSYRAPVLGLFGGADQAIASTDVASFGRALDSARVPNELITYEGAPHSFFDRTCEQHREACEDAWRRVLGFVDANS